MNIRTIAFSVAVLCVGTAAQAFTLATFSDPSNNSSSPLFTASDTAVSASWSGSGLSLVVPVTSTTYNNVQMSMASVARTGSALGAGTVIFWDSDINNPLLTIDFTSATIAEPFGTGGSFLNGDNVVFGGSAVASLGVLSDTQFSFSFANAGGTSTDRTYTASMTSSAVPEPASMIALGLGVAALASRRKKA